MTRLKEVAARYLDEGRTMQLATSVNNQPWICTVYYVTDEELNFYWLSFPSRRHSQDISENNKVAAAIQIKTDLPVIGIQFEGEASIVKDSNLIEKVMSLYIKKYDSGHKFHERFLSANNMHEMYMIKPKDIYLFDEVNNPEQGRVKLT